MSEEKPDLLGKIDAILEKRGPDALLDKGLDSEDFPLLTEVIDPLRWSGGERRGEERRQLDRRLGDRRQDGRRSGDFQQPDQPLALPPDVGEEMGRLVAAMEQRLTELFIRQQLRMEEAVRKVIRDELGKGRDDQP